MEKKAYQPCYPTWEAHGDLQVTSKNGNGWVFHT